MADQNPTGSGAAVALELPADHVRFLRGVFEKARAGIGDELEEFPDQLDPKRLEREHTAYGRLLTALDELVIVPDGKSAICSQTSPGSSTPATSTAASLQSTRPSTVS
jgi:hypothetical protein